MDKLTKAALEGSIRKWQKIVDGTGNDKGIINCPLCTAFYNKECLKCPVLIKIGERYCGNTPYVQWNQHHIYEHKTHAYDPRSTKCTKCEELAQDELNFLISLREDTGDE